MKLLLYAFFIVFMIYPLSLSAHEVLPGLEDSRYKGWDLSIYHSELRGNAGFDVHTSTITPEGEVYNDINRIEKFYGFRKICLRLSLHKGVKNEIFVYYGKVNPTIKEGYFHGIYAGRVLGAGVKHVLFGDLNVIPQTVVMIQFSDISCPIDSSATEDGIAGASLSSSDMQFSMVASKKFMGLLPYLGFKGKYGRLRLKHPAGEEDSATISSLSSLTGLRMDVLRRVSIYMEYIFFQEKSFSSGITIAF